MVNTPPLDWAYSATEAASRILRQLGIAQAASMEPGADARRDAIAFIVDMCVLSQTTPLQRDSKRFQKVLDLLCTDDGDAFMRALAVVPFKHAFPTREEFTLAIDLAIQRADAAPHRSL